MRKIEWIIIHCTATQEGRHFTVKDVDRWHRERGFKMIGYHYLIWLDGTIEKGRPEEMIGAHCVGYNHNSIGVCYVGGLKTTQPTFKWGDSTPNSNHSSPSKGEVERGAIPSDTRTPAQKEALLRLLTELKRRFPGATIVGHRKFARKACPCFDAEKEYANLS